MNAMKKYKERQFQAVARKAVNDNLDGFIEHMDLLILWVLHCEFGFGEKRLRHFFTVISEYYTAFRDRFIQPGDEYRFYSQEGRMDTFALKHRLKEIGFDYDAECEKAEAAKKESEEE